MTGKRLRTFGHGTAPESALTDLLLKAGIDTVVDVRRFPGSRRHPHVGQGRLAEWLPAAGLRYRWMAELLDLAESSAVAVMCSEAVWWRCHRRLLADHLVVVEDREVEHLFHDGRLAAHPVTAEAIRTGDRLVYPAGP